MKRGQPSAARRARPRVGHGEAPDAAPSTVEQFLREIASVPVLTRAEEQVQARRFRELRGAEHALVAGMPFAARFLQQRLRSGGTRELRRTWAAGLEAPIDAPTLAALARGLGQRLVRRPSLTAQGRAAALHWDRFEARLRAHLFSLELHPDFYDEVGAELRRLAGETAWTRRSAATELRDRVEFPLRRLRRRLVELDRAREAREAARNELARHNLKLVVRCAKDFRNLGVSFPDLMQDANIGLLRAIELFDPDRGHKFSTYAIWWIRQSLVRSVQAHSRTVRLPAHVSDRLQTLRRVEESLTRRVGRTPDAVELAKSAGLEADRVRTLQRLRQSASSLDAGTETEEGRSLHEVLADRERPSSLELVERRSRRDLAQRLLAELEPDERRLIGRRFGIGRAESEPVPFQELAGELGVSREVLRRREAAALEKLRRAARVEVRDALHTLGNPGEEPGGGSSGSG